MKYVVYDIETTGLDPNSSEIIEIGAIKIKDDNIIEEFSKLIKPTLLINEFITNLTGITNELVSKAQNEKVVLQEFNEFLKEAEIILGHNIDEFDIPFINRRLEIHGLDKIEKKTIDTLKLARNSISYKKIQNFKLDTLSEFFGIISYGSHRAIYDAKKSWEVYKKLKNYNDDVEKCPKCGNPLREVKGPYGMFLGCTGFPKCKYSRKY
ncbi:MAG: polC [Haloplasmataceae bacterium]|nr:polC [Haloplasmataceae bacterium]